ncbi:lipase family alpha/beta hydrolase [Nocardia sp. NPDC088792]|uniref:lipase family alpha/beta hydrolase n=1 Tax=Nocardia sp. NPDC088792 TaxID=3364332 RepID=UPI00380B16E3
MARTWWTVPALLATMCAVPAGAHAEPTGNPVLIVHGWTGGGAFPLPQGWSDGLRDALAADGHPVYVVDLPGELNVPNAQAIAQVAQQASQEHGGSKIDVIGHSMGGLSSRYFVKFLGGQDLTAHYISIGTGQYGWYPTCLLPAARGGEMCPSSPFLATLNHGDDTPGNVSYTTLRTLADDASFHIPSDDRALQGHSCLETGIDGGPHPEEPSNPAVIAAVLDALHDHCPGNLVDEPITQ